MIRLLLLLLLATPVAAQESFALPVGCEAFVTVQSRDCIVSHHFICEGDPAGQQRRVDLGEDGLLYAGLIDAETQWIESFHVRSGHSERLEDSPSDRASFTELFAYGIDTYDFRTLSDEIGPTRYRGQDRLTGEVVQIDGVTLYRTEYQITAMTDDGVVLWSSEGSEFISEDFRMFLSGVGTVTTPDESWEVDDSPVEFIFPGEAGFLSPNPKHGCGVMMSSFSGGN